MTKKKRSSKPATKLVKQQSDAAYARLILKAVLDELVAQGVHQQELLVAVKQQVEGQKALSDTIMLLTAKGVSKAKAPAGPAASAVKDFSTPPEGTGGVHEQGAPADVAQLSAKAPALSVVKDPEKPVTADEARSLFLAYVQKAGRPAAIALLQKYGASKISEVPEARLQEFAVACR